MHYIDSLMLSSTVSLRFPGGRNVAKRNCQWDNSVVLPAHNCNVIVRVDHTTTSYDPRCDFCRFLPSFRAFLRRLAHNVPVAKTFLFRKWHSNGMFVKSYPSQRTRSFAAEKGRKQVSQLHSYRDLIQNQDTFHLKICFKLNAVASHVAVTHILSIWHVGAQTKASSTCQHLLFVEAENFAGIHFDTVTKFANFGEFVRSV